MIGMRIYPDERLVSALMQCPMTANADTKNALDIGCGFGRHVKLLAENGYHVDGLDIGADRLKTARDMIDKDFEIVTDVNFICEDVMQYNPDKLYDVIVAWQYIFAYNRSYGEVESRLKKIYSLLKKGGYAFINFESKEDEIYKERIELYEKGSQVYRSERYRTDGYVFFDQSELVDLFTRCKFEIIRFENKILLKTHDHQNGENDNNWWKNKALDAVSSRYVVSAKK